MTLHISPYSVTRSGAKVLSFTLGLFNVQCACGAIIRKNANSILYGRTALNCNSCKIQASRLLSLSQTNRSISPKTPTFNEKQLSLILDRSLPDAILSERWGISERQIKRKRKELKEQVCESE